MKTYFECLSCLVRHALEAARHASEDEAIHEAVLRRVLDDLSEADLRRPPPVIGGLIHRTVREITGLEDPYRDAKDTCNRRAWELYPEFRELVQGSPEPLELALKLCIAGNSMDFAVHAAADRHNIRELLVKALSAKISGVVLNKFRQQVVDAKSILYLGDNAGEIIFDRLLLELLPRERITFVVKGSPVINDVTMKDAEYAGITNLVDVIDNGSDFPGTILEDCSWPFVGKFEQADVIISKGQANFESLDEIRRSIYFLFQAKCPVITRHLHCEMGALMVVGGK